MELSNPQHEAFAQHVAAGMSLTEAAKRVGYKPSAANNRGSRLAADPRIKMRLEELRRISPLVPIGTNQGVRTSFARVSALEDRWNRMRRVIEERAKDPDMQDVPGGQTGLMILSIKGIGSKENFEVVKEYRVDTALLAEIRAHEQQAAEELGQWTQRRETTSLGLNLTIGDPKQLNDYLKQEIGALPAADRALAIEAAPELAEVLGMPEPESK